MFFCFSFAFLLFFVYNELSNVGNMAVVAVFLL
jgi:hypothetical protein